MLWWLMQIHGKTEWYAGGYCAWATWPPSCIMLTLSGPYLAEALEQWFGCTQVNTLWLLRYTNTAINSALLRSGDK